MKTFKSIARLLGFLCLWPACLNAQTIADKSDSLLSAYYKQDLFTGTVLIAQKGMVVFEKSYGMANREASVSNSSATQYRIGSLSKPFTSLIILQLKEKGLINLSDPLSKYLPGFSKGDSVTIENLLNHTSGIRSFTSTRRYNTDRMNITGRGDVLDILKAEPFVFSPGSSWQYSNSNYILLSYIAEDLSKKSMTLQIQELCTKLGLKNTGMDFDGRIAPLKAKGYEAVALQDYMPVADQNIAIISGAGGMYSSAPDLLKLDRALYSEQILSDATKQQMFKPGKGDYGYGWETGNFKGRMELGHSGSIEGFKSMILRYPESETCIVFLSNYWNTPGQMICDNLKAIVFNEPYQLPASRNFISLPESQLKAFEGEFSFKGAMSMIIKAESGQLLSIIKGQPIVSFKPLNEREFYNKSNNAEMSFQKDAAGIFQSFKLVKGKQAMEWTRKEAAK